MLGSAALVQDVVPGLQAVPPNLGHDMGLPAVALLQLLEVTTRVGFCHYCCNPGSRCKCMGAYQPAPPESWSQIVEQTPGYGVTASSGGMTTPSTTVAGHREPEDGETVANLPVAPGECKSRQVGRRLIWRVIFPQRQHQTFPKLHHLKVLCLNRAVG